MPGVLNDIQNELLIMPSSWSLSGRSVQSSARPRFCSITLGFNMVITHAYGSPSAAEATHTFCFLNFEKLRVLETVIHFCFVDDERCAEMGQYRILFCILT